MYVDLIHFFSDSNYTAMIDLKKLKQDLKGDAMIIYLSNKLEEMSHVQRIVKIISEKAKVYYRTVLILPGKLSFVV